MANVHDPILEPELRLIFGDLDAIAGSDNDLFHLATQVAQSPGPKPSLFQWCGTEDFLYPANIKFRDFIWSLPFNYSYTEGPGDHTWGHWDAQIQNVLNWLPLS
jgi:S-formylglutathione hydrolase FrmB